MAIFETVLKSDLKKPVQVKQLSGNLFSGDNQGNKITVEVMDNGSPATLSGGVTGYVIREDNSTVIISSGTLSGNKASIVLPEEAYNVIGRVSIVVKVGTTTVGACTAFVYRTSTDTLVDPTGAIPSLQELLAKISACEQATADANKIANLTVSAEAATGSTPDAVLSETGSPAHKHITFKLVKGDKGDKGDTGATPQLSIGTVTTLQPSQDATVTITGTDEEPVLNFGIPQGESGNETIDDTAGIGDTDLVYSADKLAKELSQKANGENLYSYKSKSGSIVTVDDAVAEAVKQMRIEIAPVQSGTGDPSPTNIRPISGWTGANVTVSPTSNPDDPDKEVYSITFPLSAGTVYGGTLTLNQDGSGSLVVDRVSDDMGTRSWIARTGYFVSVALGKKAGDANILCENYKVTASTTVDGMADFEIKGDASNSFIYLKDSRYSTTESLKTALSGVKLVYEIDTPATYSLTAPEIITLLSGLNNVWSDTGDILSMTYPVEKFLTVEQAINVPLTTPALVQSFPDGADDLPMALTVGIEPVQDLHGYENPWPEGGGKNKFDPSLFGFGTYNGITFSRDGDDIVLNGTATATAYCSYSGLSLGDSGQANFKFGGQSANSNVMLQIVPSTGGTINLILNSAEVQTSITLSEGITFYGYIKVDSGAQLSNFRIHVFAALVEGTTTPTFSPYSNICPISGWTGAEVTRTGKNLFDPSILLTKNTWSESNGVYSGDANPINNMDFLTDLLPYEGQVTFSLDCKVNTGRAGYIYVHYSDGTLGYKEITGTEWNHRTYTTTSGKTITRIHFGVSNNYAMQIKNIQFEFGAIETAFDGYAVQSIPITFPSSAGTVYGGTLTVNKDGNGELVVDSADVDLGTLTWSAYAASLGAFTTPLAEMKNNTINALCSQYVAVRNYVEWSAGNRVFYKDQNGKLHLKDSTYANYSVSDFKTAMSGVQLVYELATPVTYFLTPGQVKTLLGVNNIWADTGDIISVTYPADTKLYIDKKFAELSAAITALGT